MNRIIERPERSEAQEYANSYIDKVEGDDLLANLRLIHDHTWKILSDLRVSPDHRYALGKWSIKEVIQHLIDTERIFCFRALAFARGEKQELPGFAENEYAVASRTDQRDFGDILKEFDVVRASTRELYQSFDEEMQLASGVANKEQISVRALGWMLAGHEMHHVHVIKERYLVQDH